MAKGELAVTDAQLIETLFGRSTGAVDREVRRSLRQQLGFSLRRQVHASLAVLTTARIIK
jgi:hypothetical protein